VQIKATKFYQYRQYADRKKTIRHRRSRRTPQALFTHSHSRQLCASDEDDWSATRHVALASSAHVTWRMRRVLVQYLLLRDVAGIDYNDQLTDIVVARVWLTWSTLQVINYSQRFMLPASR